MPDRNLFLGRPSGSAMPLVWAHAEYVKLRRSLRDGRVFDMPRQTVQRYIVAKTGSPYSIWRSNTRVRHSPRGKILRIELREAATIHWSTDGWQTTRDTALHDTGLGIHLTDLPVQDLAEGSTIDFTIHWTKPDRWEGQDYHVQVIAPL